MNQTSQVLTIAAQYVRAGWTQHASICVINNHRSVCALEAINLAVDRVVPDPNAREAVLEAAINRLLQHARIGILHSNITVWNDAPTMTQEKVVAALEGAAK